MADPSELMVYVGRGQHDSDWFCVGASLAEVQQLIAVREPDIVKQGFYQILVEPLSKLLQPIANAPDRSMTHTLVKWDGEGEIPEDAAMHPDQYPQVHEVIQAVGGQPPVVTYRRESNAAH